MQQEQKILRRLAILLLAGYLAAVVLFYFLAGEQLHLRESRGNIDVLPAEKGTMELTAGCVVEQRFTTKVQRLEEISVQWGTYYRQNAGMVLVELWDLQNNCPLLSQNFDAATVTEGGFTTLTTKEAIEGLHQRPLALRITSIDGQLGTSPSPLMNNGEHEGEWELFIDGISTPGTLCFAARGTDYIWTGLHYWEFAAAGLGLLLLFLAGVWYHVKKGRRSYVINAIIAMDKYRFLIRQLVVRDFKTKYKRSVLGVFWSFLNPLLTMCVQYFVFSMIFKSDIPYYAVYLLIGIVTFNFFSEACGMALSSIVGNAPLITKVYMPKYIYPLTRVMSSIINLGISLIPLFLVSILTGVPFKKSVVLSLYFLWCIIIFSLGLGLFLSTSMVFFRDTQFLWGVLSMIWMYATPIFYPESILPDNFKLILKINPLYHFLKNIRICILDGISPEPVAYVGCILIALLALVIGSLVFWKNQDRFLLYL